MIRKISCFSFVFFNLLLPPVMADMPQRIVSTDGAVTEIIYSLGEERLLAGVDTTSYYPESTNAIPKVGYKRALATEGILSLNPDLIIATEDAGPPQVLKTLKETGIKMLVLKEDHTIDNLYHKIREISKALSVSEKGEELIKTISLKEDEVQKKVQQSQNSPKVLFILYAGQGTPLVAGKNTAADAIIALSGGINVVSEYEGYKPLNAEAMANADPEVLLVTTQGNEALGGKENLLKLPGVNLTKAGQKENIVIMDTIFLLGFGPRIPDAIEQLHEELQHTR